MEDTSSIAAWYGKQELLTGEILDIDQYMEKIMKVDKEATAAVANKIFDFKKINIAVIGPVKDEEKIRKILK